MFWKMSLYEYVRQTVGYTICSVSFAASMSTSAYHTESQHPPAHPVAASAWKNAI